LLYLLGDIRGRTGQPQEASLPALLRQGLHRSMDEDPGHGVHMPDVQAVRVDQSPHEVGVCIKGELISIGLLPTSKVFDSGMLG